MRTILIAVFTTLAGLAQGLQLIPVKPADGPQLFFHAQEDAAGRRVNVHYLLTAGARGMPQPFLRTPDDLTFRHRIDRRRVVCEHDGSPTELILVDIENATVKDLASGPDLRFVSAANGRVVFREGRALLARAVDGGVATRVIPADIGAIQASSRGILFASQEAEPRLWVADADGTRARPVCLLNFVDPRRHSMRAELSPNGSRIAVASTVPDLGWCLTVIGLDGRSPVRVLENVDVRVSMLSSILPTLEFCWLTDSVVRFSETRDLPAGTEDDEGSFQFVDFDVDRRVRLAERVYGKVALRHEKPRASWPESVPTSRGHLADAATIPDASGRWAVRFVGFGTSAPALDLLDSKEGTTRRVFEGAVYDPTWWP